MTSTLIDYERLSLNLVRLISNEVFDRKEGYTTTLAYLSVKSCMIVPNYKIGIVVSNNQMKDYIIDIISNILGESDEILYINRQIVRFENNSSIYIINDNLKSPLTGLLFNKLYFDNHLPLTRDPYEYDMITIES